MADEPNDDELLLDQQLEPGDDPDDQRDDDDSDPNVNDEDDEEEVLSFGDEGDDHDGDTNLVKHLRSEIKKARQEAAEARRSAPREQAVEVGDKPTLAAFDYDEDRFEAELDAWKDRKAKAARQQGQSQDAQRAEQTAWEEELARVQREKLQLGADDADDAFDLVRSSLSPIQQAVLVKATDNTARVIYALAKHPDRLAELAGIEDPLRLAAKIAKLEGQLKVVKRRKAPDPDRPERGSAKVSATARDKQIEKLEKEADRTGERTALIAARKKLAAVKK